MSDTENADGGGLFGVAEDPAGEAPVGGDLFASEPGVELPENSLDPVEGVGGQPLISAEESEALIQAMRAGSLAPAALSPPEPASAATDATTVRLGAPEELLRRAIERADRVVQDLADAVVGALLEQVGIVADADVMDSAVAPIEQTFEAYVATATAWDAVPRGARGPWATIVLGGNFADVVLSRRLGADGAVAKPSARSRVSALGRRVLAPVAAGCVRVVANGLVDGLAGAELVAAGSTELKVVPSAPCLRLGVRVRMGEIEDDVLVVLYEPALAPRPGTGRETAEGVVRMRNALHDVDVELRATLGTARMSVRELLALGTGSVVRLNGTPERPVTVSAAGTPVLSGMPIVHQGNMAIEVIT